MRLFVLLLMVVMGLAGVVAARADDTDPEPPMADKSALVGEWELVSINHKGVDIKLPANVLQITLKLEKNGTMTMTTMGMTQKGKWKIDSSKKPKHIDITANNQGGLAIYKLDKGELTLASGEGPQAARPKDFESAEATMVLKKKKK
jgi:uncharacterized protein (TIGR03067 family)